MKLIKGVAINLTIQETKNDSTMVIRMFEYGFRKSIEQSRSDNISSTKTIYYPKQKVIFFEENHNIKDTLDLKIVFPNNQQVLYSVGVIKYWEYNNKILLQNKMYPLMPLQLFLLRKELKVASNNNNKQKLKELSYKARHLAHTLAYEARDLLKIQEILDEDFHKMLLAIQNLIEYLNRNYINDEYLEEEVGKLTKSLYDPEVEKKAMEKTEIGIVLNMISEGLNEETISKLTRIDINKVKEIKEKYKS